SNARTHLKVIKANLGERYQQMFRLKNILVLLVDSGASYMVLQAIFLAMYSAGLYTEIPSQPFLTAYVALEALYSCVSFVYPAITIFLVHGPLSIVAIHNTVMSFSILADEPHAQGSELPGP
ncbi:hypothetical protein DXG01_006149, partial [Tephrocybe rancida]